MTVDRLSVTVPGELGVALRELAERRGETVSNLVTEAIARQVRLAALDDALALAARRHGALDDESVRRAEDELVQAMRPRRGRRRAR